MTGQEHTDPAPSPLSPYLSLRRAVRPAIFAYRLLAADTERAGKLAAECEDLLLLTRELLTAAGQAHLLAGPPGHEAAAREVAGYELVHGPGGDRQAQILDAYADAGLLWAKVVGGCLALARTLLDRGDWDEVRRLADFLAGAGEAESAAYLRSELGAAVWAAHGGQLSGISNAMPPEDIARAIDALRAILREVPEDYPGRNAEVNRLLPPLAASIYAIMQNKGVEISYNSRVEHIATGGVAKYPDIVTTSLDDLSAEFNVIYR
jgi:hypothetical protein